MGVPLRRALMRISIHEAGPAIVVAGPATHGSPSREAPRATGQLPVLDHAVGEPVGDCLGAGEVPVALHVGMHPLDRLTGVLGVDLVDARTQRQDLLGVDLHVGALALVAAGRLMDQDPAVGQRQPLAVGAAGQQQ